MDKRIALIKLATQSHPELLPKVTDSELRQYTCRAQVDGELKAMDWLVMQLVHRP